MFLPRRDLVEIPIVEDGKVVARVTRLPAPKRLSTSISTGIPTDFHEYDVIYVSSFEDENICRFYNRCSPELFIVPLTNENLPKALHGENGLLIYASDIFPECSKMDIEAVYSEFITQEMKGLDGRTFIVKDWASISHRDLGRVSKMIEIFDEGHRAIAVEDDAGKVCAVVTPSTLWEAFPGKNLRMFDNAMIPYSDDAESMRQAAVRLFYGSVREEIPVVKDGRVVASAIRGFSIQGLTRQEFRRAQPLRWDYIGDEVLKKFLGKTRKILISSRVGSMAGFYERFSVLTDVTVFEDREADRLFTGGFDIAVFGTAYYLPKSLPVPVYDADFLYSRLLVEEVRTQLERGGVSYHIFTHADELAGLEAATSIKHRINRKDRGKTTSTPPVVRMGRRNAWYGYADAHNGEISNWAGGRRRTVGVPEKFLNTIYFIGECTASGTAGEDDKTIESFLQMRMNERKIPCRAVNLGVANPDFYYGTDGVINQMYQVIDLELHPGDAVIQFTYKVPFANGVGALPAIPRAIYHRERDVYDAPGHLQEKCFIDGSAAHVNRLGARIMADYLFSLLEQKLPKAAGAFWLFPGSESMTTTATDSRDLREYLTKLSRYRVSAGKIGAIVMNANPFTKGHAHLVDVARRTSDFLYVFVVEEDLSEISFADRFEIVTANAQKYPNVRVLPSGRYMISRATFGEYFNKDSLQDQAIHPASDVNLFGRHIAPCLSITRRFVGEEPIDTVTRQYNEAMRDILPGYGVEVTEIPRLKSYDGEVINATRVRKLLREGRLLDARPFLTEETYEYISRNFERIRSRMGGEPTRSPDV